MTHSTQYALISVRPQQAQSNGDARTLRVVEHVSSDAVHGLCLLYPLLADLDLKIKRACPRDGAFNRAC